MVRLASTEIDKSGTIIKVSKPDSSYLQGILPHVGYNIFSFGDKETKEIIKKYLDQAFESYLPIELTLNIKSHQILLTTHCFEEGKAFILWKDISTVPTAPPFQTDWGFDELSLQERIDIEIPKRQYDVKRFTDNLPLVVFEIYLYPDGRFQFGFVNKEMETFFPGFNKEAINSDNSLLFIRVHPEDKQKLLDSIKDVFKLKVWNIEYRIVENGETRWVRGFGRPEIGNEGDRITVCTYLEDVTEKKLISERLELVDFSFRNASTPIVLTNTDGSFFDFNDAFCLQYKYSRTELATMRVQDLDQNPDYSIENWAKHWEKLKAKKQHIVETSHRLKDGALIEVVIKTNIIHHNGQELNCAYITDVTEKNKLDERLKLVDYSFRNAATPILLLLEDATFFDFNESMLQLLGYEFEEFKHLTISDIDPAFDKASCKERWVEFRKIKKATFPNRLKKKDGEMVDVEIRSNLISYGGKEINYSFILDITEKKKLENKLELVDFIFRNTVTAITLIKEDGSFYDFNEAAYSLFGYTKEEYAQLSVQKTNTTLNGELWKEHWAELKRQKNLVINNKIKNKKGEILDIEVRANLMMYGDLELNFTIATDITESRKLDDKLKLVDFAFRNAKIPMYFTEQDGRIFDFNEEAYKALGYKKEEFQVLSVYDISNRHTPETWKIRWAELKKNNSLPHITKLRRKDKTIIDAEMRTSVINYGGQDISVTSFIDITEKKKLEEQLKLVGFSFENVDTAIIFSNEDASIHSCNKAFCDLYGYTTDEMKQLTMRDFGTGFTTESWKLYWENLKANQKVSFITKRRKKDGSEIDVEINANYIKLGNLEVNCAFVYDITEKKKLEDQLELINFSFQHAVTPIVFIREDGMFHDFNEAYVQLSGYSREELQTRKIFDINNSFDSKNWPCHWNELKEKGTMSFITNRTKKDGSINTVDVRANLINFRGIELNCAFITDISEKKKADEALKLSNERYEFATLATSDVVWETDLVNDILYLGNNFTTVFGLETTGIEYGPNNVWRNNLHPDDLQSTLEKELNSIVGKSDKWESEYRLRKGNGEYAIVLDRGFVVKDNSGKSIRLIGAMQDITERKKIEDALNLVDFSFKNAVTPIMYIREDASLYAFNDAFVDMLGYERNELSDMKVFDMDPDFYPEIWPHHWAELKLHGKLSFTTKKMKKDGSILDVAVNANLIKYGSIELNCAFVTDITEKNKIEEQLKRSNQRYEYATLATSDVVWETDLKAETIYISNNFTNIYGHPVNEVEPLGDSVWTRNVHPDDLQMVLDTETEVIKENGDKWVAEYRFRRADGSYAFVLDRSFAIKDEYGVVTGMIGSMQDITEKKQVEIDLKNSNERYEYVTLATSDVIWEHDLKRNMLYYSDNFTAVFGHKLDRNWFAQGDLNNIWWQNVHPEDYERAIEFEKKVLASDGRKWESEYRLRKADGTYAWVYDRGFAIKDANGDIIRWVGSMQDITEKKKYEQEITRSNMRFEYATLATSDVIWEADLIANTYFSSKSFTDIFGHKSGIYEDIVENEWNNNVHPDDLGIVLKRTNDSIQGNINTWKSEYRFRMANGEYAIVLDRIFVVRDETGTPIRLVGALQNITETKQREERLKLLETVITNTTDAIIIRDSKRLATGGLPVLYTNHAFTQMTGYSFEEARGRTLKFMNGPLTDRAERDKLRIAVNQFVPGNMEVINYRKDGTPFWASISVFPVANENGEFTHWVSIQRDITQKKKAEEEREHLLNELISNNKELKQFGYITTHNLRAPLTNLVSICKLLDVETISDLRNKKLIEGFKQSTFQLNDTLNDLINILIIKENRNLPTAELGFHDMLNRVLTSISNTFSIAEAVIVSDFSEAPIVEFSNTYLESIFLNLLTNAIKYAHPDRKPFIKIDTVKNENGTTKLTFSDNGIGMNMNRVKDRIFGLYQRFHNNADSKGIGLYLIHSQITALGGSIEVESQENIGTTFTITFR